MSLETRGARIESGEERRTAERRREWEVGRGCDLRERSRSTRVLGGPPTAGEISIARGVVREDARPASASDASERLSERAGLERETHRRFGTRMGRARANARACLARAAMMMTIFPSDRAK
jgi:hypothetical protein